MSIVRTVKERKFFVASNDLFNDRRLSWEARGIMGYLLSKPDGWQCHNYDLVNQSAAGKHVVHRVLKELKEFGYVRRYQESNGSKIEWVTEVYENPELNTAFRNTNSPQAEKPPGGKSGDIVSTNLSKDLPLVNTDEKLSANADFRRPISSLSLDEIKDKTKGTHLPLGVWEGWLEDEQTERRRKGVVRYIEGEIKYINLRPANEEELQLFEILTVEYKADGGKSPPDKFPTLETKRLFNEAARFHNSNLETVVKKAIHKRGKAIRKIVDYINSPEWRNNQKGHSNEQGNRSKKGNSGSGKAQGRGFQPGNGRSAETQRRLEAAFAPKPG